MAVGEIEIASMDSFKMIIINYFCRVNKRIENKLTTSIIWNIN
jgi:hypothetical protein